MDPYQYHIRHIQRENNSEIKAIRDFLHTHHLHYESDCQLTLGVFRKDQLVGTGSLAGNVLKCVAVDDDFQGEGIAAAVVTHLVEAAYERGRQHLFIYTPPDRKNIFGELGFYEVVSVPNHVALFENQANGLASFLEAVKKATRERFPDPDALKHVSSIVMNANPFTLGHQHLVSTASSNSDLVHVFVVTEDKSSFPTKARFQMVKDGTAHLANVMVHQGGPYMVSSATFPSYFLKEPTAVSAIHHQLDLTLFGSRIAPALGIQRRYVGQEPYCLTTQDYNRAMKEILPVHGVEVIEIPRLSNDQGWISASTVRQMLLKKQPDLLQKLVPESTMEYLFSEKGKEIIESLSPDDRH